MRWGNADVEEGWEGSFEEGVVHGWGGYMAGGMGDRNVERDAMAGGGLRGTLKLGYSMSSVRSVNGVRSAGSARSGRSAGSRGSGRGRKAAARARELEDRERALRNEVDGAKHCLGYQAGVGHVALCYVQFSQPIAVLIPILVMYGTYSYNGATQSVG